MNFNEKMAWTVALLVVICTVIGEFQSSTLSLT